MYRVCPSLTLLKSVTLTCSPGEFSASSRILKSFSEGNEVSKTKNTCSVFVP